MICYLLSQSFDSGIMGRISWTTENTIRFLLIMTTTFKCPDGSLYKYVRVKSNVTDAMLKEAFNTLLTNGVRVNGIYPEASDTNPRKINMKTYEDYKTLRKYMEDDNG